MMVVQTILPALALTAAFAAPAAFAVCAPNYQVSHEACRPTTVVTGMATMKVENVRVNSGACEPDAANLCASYNKTEFAKAYPGVDPAQIVAVESHTETAEGKYCGKFPDVKNKVDVYCTFQFQAPQFAMVADASCPVNGAADVNGCYLLKPIVIDMNTVTSCLDAQPETESQWWIKSMCLADVYKASAIFSTKGLDIETLNIVGYQLNIIDQITKKQPSLLKLNQTLQTVLPAQ